MAVSIVAAVLQRGRTLDSAVAEAFTGGPGAGLEPRDRALARLIATTVLRRRGEFTAVVETYLKKKLPDDSGRLMPILMAATAQLLALGTPAHAAISLAVDQCRADARARRFGGLANAVLRRVAVDGPGRMRDLDAVALNIPAWLLVRWRSTYGEADARRIAAASLTEAPLDISVKHDAADWSQRLGGTLLQTGSIRLGEHGRIEDLPGFVEGAWWVQDAAAALPARLLGDVAGASVADLCAAPGGKTAQLAAAGARVVAVDVSTERLRLVAENMTRLGLQAELVVADVVQWTPGRRFGAVLLDAPCSATGTIRRHPDILHLKRAADVDALARLQSCLLDAAVRLVEPGGFLVYCTCSLEPEEGADQIERLLARAPSVVRVGIEAGEAGIASDWITSKGELRTLPVHSPGPSGDEGGMDGFFAARLRRLD